jgi:hypothetical protein
VFESRVLRRVFEPHRNDVTGGWTKLHNEEIHNLYSSPKMIKSRRMRWEGYVARMWEMRNVVKISVGMPEGKRPLVKHRRKWKDNIKLNLRDITLEVVVRSFTIGIGGRHLSSR